jgi:sn-glycerol 3-phosphate transport system ATP-binding protein/multiple sugar transport system ATP-binding protein
VTLGVRPHDVTPAATGSAGEAAAPRGGKVTLEVSIVEALGAESHAHGTLGGAPFIARLDAATAVKKGERLEVSLDNVHLFDRKTGESLRAQQP